MSQVPLAQPCLHLATPEEHRRDPAYTCCNAQAGQPCQWAKRYDGVEDPPFHTERLEAAALQTGLEAALNTETFREAVLDTGLI